jgi:probable HAF family extracellular repeat protein
MKTIAAKLGASVLSGLLLSSALFATDYRYVKIDVPNGGQTIARGINARGDVIGDYVDANGVGRDFLLHNGVYTNIDYPGGAGAARAINARGDIAGALDDADGGHGFLFHDGKITKIDYPGAIETRAFGINNTGDITGQYTNKFGVVFGFILKDGTFRKIRVPGSDLTSLHGAEDNGRVMTGDVVVSADSSIRGFIQHKPGDVQLLDPPGTKFPCSHARVINERGDVVGAFMIVNKPEECTRPNHGFVFRQGAYDVIDPPGSLDTFAFGINDDGIVVGAFTDKHGTLHGFKAVPKN